MQQYKYWALALVLCSGCAATKDVVLHDRAKDYKTAKTVGLVIPENQKKNITFKQEYAIPAVTTEGHLAPSDIPPGMENELK